MANMTKNSSGEWVYNSTDNSNHTLYVEDKYVDGNIVVNGAGTPTRSGNTVSWGTGWVTEGSSTGATAYVYGYAKLENSGTNIDFIDEYQESGAINDIRIRPYVYGGQSYIQTEQAGWIDGTYQDRINYNPVSLAINGVTLNAPSSGTNKFNITVPNGSGTITFQFSVDTSGNVTVTESEN